MNKYPQYKDVNISWTNTIPIHWETKKIAEILYCRKEKNSKNQTSEVLSLSKKHGITLASERKNVLTTRPSEDLTPYNICYPGDLVFNAYTVFEGSVGISNYFGCVSTIYNALVNKDSSQVCTKYIYYLFKYYKFRGVLLTLGKGLVKRRMGVTWKTLKTQLLPFPPHNEQQQIADYLDWKINSINELINIESKKLKLLDKQKQALISEAYSRVTEKRRLKHLVSERLSCGLCSSGTPTGITRFIRITDIDKNGNLKTGNCLYLDEYKPHYLLKDKDILFAQSGHTVGKSYLHKNTNNPMVCASYLIRVRVDSKLILPEYVFLYSLSKDFDIWKNSIANQTTVANINTEKYSNLLIPYTDISTQQSIVDYCSRVISTINEAKEVITQKLQELEKLKESLISEVVTGQIDVRNVVIPEYSFSQLENFADVDDSEDEESDSTAQDFTEDQDVD